MGRAHAPPGGGPKTGWPLAGGVPKGTPLGKKGKRVNTGVNAGVNKAPPQTGWPLAPTYKTGF
jgi:hypothetical protein